MLMFFISVIPPLKKSYPQPLTGYGYYAGCPGLPYSLLLYCTACSIWLKASPVLKLNRSLQWFAQPYSLQFLDLRFKEWYIHGWQSSRYMQFYVVPQYAYILSHSHRSSQFFIFYCLKFRYVFVFWTFCYTVGIYELIRFCYTAPWEFMNW